uniref:Uncharacterized protein n=1 Tax=Anguilla anguilla TaxID=7936 RepID=A0A0E9S4Z3_ANGAN
MCRCQTKKTLVLLLLLTFVVYNSLLKDVIKMSNISESLCQID